MYRDRDFDAECAPPVNADDLTRDLELDTLWNAMCRGDDLLRTVARTALLDGLTTPEEIRYRQAVLTDCLEQPSVVHSLYELAGEAIAEEKTITRGFFGDRPASLLHRSVRALEIFVEVLKRLREVADQHAHEFRSAAFTRFFEMLVEELDDSYLQVIDHHVKELRFRDGLLMSACLGEGNQGSSYVLREPKDENRSFLFNRVAVKRPTHSLTIAERDEAGARALSDLRDRALNEVANAAAQSADHVRSFVSALRTELAFYLGCLNLHEQLAAKDEPMCFPTPDRSEDRVFSARGLYEPSLSLSVPAQATGNDVEADLKSLVLVTGANQGGKSTFLRAVGVAQLMMQAGMFVAARECSMTPVLAVFTHYKREEDATMGSGKLDEELNRMSDIADHIRPGSLLLCNESFAATNEREGSEIARQVVHALVDAGVTFCFVTHMYDLAHGLYDAHSPKALFLRAEREAGGRRTFRLVPGAPLPTSYGQDLYTRIFSVGPGSGGT